jgi:hypothetical protein
MYFEIQIDMTSLTQIIQTQVEQRVLSSTRLGIGGIFPLPFNGLENALEDGVVDHISVDSVTIEHNSDVARQDVEIRLPPVFGTARPTGTITVEPLWARCVFNVYCVRVSDLRANGAEAATDDQIDDQIQVRANLELTQPVQQSGNRLRILLHLESLELGYRGVFLGINNLPPTIRITFNHLTTGLVNSGAFELPTLDFPLNGIIDLLGSDAYEIWNAGMNISRSVLTIRVQVDRSNLIELFPGFLSGRWIRDWNAFLNWPPERRLNGNDWAVFVPMDFFHTRITQELVAGFEGRTDVFLHPSALPRSTWYISGAPVASSDSLCRPGGEARVRTDFAIVAVGACEPWGIDINVNVGLNLVASMPRAGIVRLDVNFEHEADPGAAALCAFIYSWIISTAAFGIGGAVGGWVGAAIGAVAGGLAGAIATLALIYTRGPGRISSDELHPVEGTNNAYYTEIPFETLSNPFLGDLSPSALIPCSDGLMLAGTIAETGNVLRLLDTVHLPDPYRWFIKEPRCPSSPWGPEIVVRGYLSWDRTRLAANIPLVGWGITFLESTPSQYQDYVDIPPFNGSGMRELRMEYTIFNLRRLRQLAEAEGPDELSFTVLLQTNAGARIITVPGPGPEFSMEASQAELEQLQRWCEGLAARQRDFEERARRLIDVIDVLEPPFEFVEPDAFNWSVIITDPPEGSNLQLGRLIDLEDRFEVLETVQPEADGLIYLNFWQLEKSTMQPNAMMISGQFEEFASKKAKDDRRTLRIFADMYRLIKTIPIDSNYCDHSLGEQDGKLVLSILTADRLIVYDLTNLYAPYPRLAVLNKALEHVQVFPDSILAWGMGGLWYTDRQVPWTQVFDCATVNVEREGNLLVAETPSSGDIRLALNQISRSGAGEKELMNYELCPPPARIATDSRRKPLTLAQSPPARKLGGVAAVLDDDKSTIQLLELFGRAIS